jgi:hypothetical protein
VLRRLVKGRLAFKPRGNHYEFEGTGTLRPLLAGVIQNLAPPSGNVDSYLDVPLSRKT